ncbi:hemolymph lipopolysaccharide-binding protein [Anabrus simplex]|uniref:hemolymph lipopolysaccharide-binding protein n=1 Tax=Anabrus simplex TaxID=316456 RepID=UPI0035A3D0F3
MYRDILVLGVILLVMKTSLQDQCSREVHLSLYSSRNQTGHWQTLITWDQEVLQDIDTDNRETAPILLGMSQRVAGCTGHEMFYIRTRLVMSSPRAGPGYITVPDVGRYKFHTTAVTWEAARMICSNEGGHLAVIRSKAQEDYLKKMFARHPKIEKTNWNEIAWLGFHDRHTEGEFITVLGEPFHLVGYANWDSGKPDNLVWGGYTTDSDCGAMRRTGKIIDLPCSANYSFFCEQN